MFTVLVFLVYIPTLAAEDDSEILAVLSEDRKSGAVVFDVSCKYTFINGDEFDKAEFKGHYIYRLESVAIEICPTTETGRINLHKSSSEIAKAISEPLRKLLTIRKDGTNLILNFGGDVRNEEYIVEDGSLCFGSICLNFFDNITHEPLVFVSMPSAAPQTQTKKSISAFITPTKKRRAAVEV